MHITAHQILEETKLFFRITPSLVLLLLLLPALSLALVVFRGFVLLGLVVLLAVGVFLACVHRHRGDGHGDSFNA